MYLSTILGWVFLLTMFATGDKFISYLCLSSFCIGVICWFKFVIDYLKLKGYGRHYQTYGNRRSDATHQ